MAEGLRTKREPEAFAEAFTVVGVAGVGANRTQFAGCFFRNDSARKRRRCMNFVVWVEAVSFDGVVW